MKAFFKNFLSFVYCLLSLAIFGFSVYKIIESKNFEPSLKLHITESVIINNIIETVIKFDEYLDGVPVLGIGTVALLFMIFFSDSMHEFFSKLPLGSIRKYDYFSKKKRWKNLTSLLPSLIIGLYTTIHFCLYKMFPEKLDFCVKWILPATVILTSIVSVMLVVFIIRDGGLWGLIVRVPLLFTINLCFSAIIVPILLFSGILIAMITVIVVTFAILGICGRDYVVIYRD